MSLESSLLKCSTLVAHACLAFTRSFSPCQLLLNWLAAGGSADVFMFPLFSNFDIFCLQYQHCLQKIPRMWALGVLF